MTTPDRGRPDTVDAVPGRPVIHLWSRIADPAGILYWDHMFCCQRECCRSVVSRASAVAPLEPLHASLGVYDSRAAGVKRMAR